jgi:hypothetical protein
MRVARHLSLLIIPLGLLLTNPANAQAPPDSALTALSDTAAIASYTNSPAARERLYNGPLYTGYDHHPQGHPFFIADTLMPASIEYDGVLFPATPVTYDLFKDVLVLHNTRKAIDFQLVPEKIGYFTLAQHKFIYLPADSSTPGLPATGYYEELYSGKTTALARHLKVIQQGNAAENLSNYRQYDFYYLQVAGRYYPIHSEKAMLAALGADKGRVREFIKRSRLKFRKDPAGTLAKVAEYYSQSPNITLTHK